MLVVFTNINSSMSINKEEAYKIMKKNIVSVGYDYVNECTQGLITCDFSFSNHNYFYANDLKTTGYLNDLKSPIDGRELGECLQLVAKKDNGVVIIDLNDTCY